MAIVKSGLLFLLVQNPEKGLLAGLWDFPHVLTEDDSSKSSVRRELINDYLPTFIKGIESGIKKRVDQGQCLHLFTHIKRTMFVEVIELDETLAVDDGQGFKWVNEADMLQMAVPTTLKKAFALFTATAKGRKRKAEKGQSSILGFLKKSK